MASSFYIFRDGTTPYLRLLPFPTGGSARILDSTTGRIRYNCRYVNFPSNLIPMSRPRQHLANVAVCLFLIVLLLTVSGCKRRPRIEEAPPQPEIILRSELAVNDPDAGLQLTHGFYGLEDNQWRWAASDFGIVLAEPDAVQAASGATLELNITVPGPVIERLGPVTLSATFNGHPLAEEIYAEAGQRIYTRPINPAWLTGQPAAIEFHADKAIAPEGAEMRELSVIVTSIALLPASSPRQ